MQKRFASWAALMAAGAVVLAGCASADTEATTSPAPGETSAPAEELKTIKVWADEQRGPALQTILEGNTEIAPGYVITIEIFPALDALQSAWDKTTAADGPDVITGPASFALSGKDGRLVPLTVSDAVRQDLGDASLAALSYGGSLYGIPLDTDTTAFVWNKAFGEAPATLGDLVSLYEANRSTLSAGLCAAEGTWGAQPFLTAMGGGAWGFTANGEADLDTVKLNSDEFKANFAEFELGGANRNFFKWDGCMEDFKAGKIPAVNTGPWNFDGIGEAGVDYELGVFPGLTADTKGAQWVNYSGAFVTSYAATNGVELGAKILVAEWMASPEGQKAIAEAQGRPAVSVIAASQIDNPASAAVSNAGATGMAQISPALDNATSGSNWYDTIGALFTALFIDGSEANKALDDAAALIKVNFEAAKADR
jgi:arabinogalactan oligomer / maltooligosaccharide transport system substrate-binding protein